MAGPRVFDMITAIIAALRADTTTMANGKTISAMLKAAPVGKTADTTARIFGKHVPPGALFPRCYVHLRTPSGSFRTSNENDRMGKINVLFVSTDEVSVDPEYDIELLDKRAHALLDYGINLSGLVYLRHSGDEPANPQEDDRTNYLMGGSIYDYLIQD